MINVSIKSKASNRHSSIITIQENAVAFGFTPLEKFKMPSIRSHSQLSLLFSLSKAGGLFIPDPSEEWKTPQKPKVWEVFVLLSIATVSLLMTYMFATNYFTFKMVDLGQPVAILTVYIVALSRTILLLTKKSQLLDIFKRMDEITHFPPLQQFQKPVVDLVCKRIRKTLVILIAVSLICCTMSTLTFVMFNYLIRQKSRNEVFTKDEEITNKLVRFEDYHTSYLVLVSHAANTVIMFLMPIKNITMDSILFLCHYFVVQQLNLLRKRFKDTKKHGKSKKMPIICWTEQLDMENWITMFNKIREYVILK
jgi:hypothetical protein